MFFHNEYFSNNTFFYNFIIIIICNEDYVLQEMLLEHEREQALA